MSLQFLLAPTRDQAWRALWLGALGTLPIGIALTCCYFGLPAAIVIGVASMWAVNRGSPRGPALFSVLMVLHFASRSWGVAIFGGNRNAGLVVDTFDPTPSAYGFARTDRGDLIVTHAHAPPSGIAVVSPDGDYRFTPMTSPFMVSATALPGGSAIVHDHEAGLPASAYVLDPSRGTWDRVPGSTPYMRSLFADGSLFLIYYSRSLHQIHRSSIERLMTAQQPTERWTLPTQIEEIVRHPTEPILYGRGEGSSSTIVRLDTRTGELRFSARLRPWHWGLAIGEKPRRVFVSNAIANEIMALDYETLELKEVVPVEGIPRKMAYIPHLDALAVGTYAGERILFLARADADRWVIADRVRACARVRWMDFDEASSMLYFTDDCGGRRLHLPSARWWPTKDPTEGAS